MNQQSKLAWLTEGERDDLREYMEVDETTLRQRIPHEVLDRILDEPGLGKRSVACGVLAWCRPTSIGRSDIRPCAMAPECECSCHQRTLRA